MPITVVPTSIAAFVGATKDGPMDSPQRVLSFVEYEAAFGGLAADSEVSYAVLQFFANGGREAWVVRHDGADIGSREAGTGIYALDSVDLFNILCVPGMSDAAAVSDAMAYCAERRAFFIVDPPQSAIGAKDLLLWAESIPRSRNGALYYPWIHAADPLQGGAPRVTPPSGTIAGVYASTDTNRGVWKAPAGTGAKLTGVTGLAHRVSAAESQALSARGVNCLRVFPASGPVVWGAKTLEGDNTLASEWKYVPVRRLALFLEESLARGTQWAVFEPNDEPLWVRILEDAGAFLHDLWRTGALMGVTPREAYFVKCGRDTMTQDDIDNGRLNILVGFAPLRPAEFILIRIQHLLG